jgi:hypothetical protein
MKLNLTEQETCPRCGAKFDCGKSGKCWCFEVDVPPSVLEKMDAVFNSCLCPDCLNELSTYKTDLPL